MSTRRRRRLVVENVETNKSASTEKIKKPKPAKPKKQKQ